VTTRRCFVPLGPLKIPPQSEAVLESHPMERPFKIDRIVFPASVSLGPNNDARLSWKDPAFRDGKAPTFLFGEWVRVAPIGYDQNPLQGKEIKVGEKVRIQLVNESYGVLEVRAGLFGWPTDDAVMKTPEERRALIEKLRKSPEHVEALWKLLRGNKS
jgi:hypothetical protein